MLLISCSRNEFDNVLRDHKTTLDFDGRFSVKSVSDKPLIVLGENLQQKELIKIHIKTVSDLAAAKEEVKKSLFLMMGQYEFSLAPYPGQITTAVNCGTDFKPARIEKENVMFIKAYANERLALSICKEDDYFYQIYTSYFLNEDHKQLLLVDYYMEKSAANDDKAAAFFAENFKSLKSIDLKEFASLIR